MRKLSTAVLVVTLGIPCAPAHSEKILQYGLFDWSKGCLTMTRKWEGYRGWKAIAVSSSFKNLSLGDNLPYQECGHSWKYDSRDGAAKEAMRQCVRGLHKYGGIGKATCSITVVRQ